MPFLERISMANILPDTIVRAKFSVAREVAFGSITNSFTRIGTPFDDNFSILFIQNFTDTIMDFSVSFDGNDITFSLAAGGTISTDMASNQVQISRGESAWVKYRSVPSSGFVQVASVIPV
jgi:uncharacterized membrane protein (DUF4010 family)